MNQEEPRKTTVGTKEASAIVGMTQRSLSNYITSGKLSAIRDESGSYQIQLCELYRLWPDKSNRNSEKRSEKLPNDSKEILLEVENKHLKEMINFLNKQLELSGAKEATAITERAALLATITSTQKLLEHVSGKKTRKKFLGIF